METIKDHIVAIALMVSGLGVWWVCEYLPFNKNM